MGNATENYRGDNERKTQNGNLEEVKRVDGKRRNNLGILIRNLSQCFGLFLASLYHRFGCLLAFLVLWIQNGLFLLVIFLLNSVKPALDGFMTNKNVNQKEQEKCSKNSSYTLNKCEYAQFILLYSYFFKYIFSR